MSSACLCDSTDITLKCAIGDIHLSQSVAQNNDRFNLKKENNYFKFAIGFTVWLAIQHRLRYFP